MGSTLKLPKIRLPMEEKRHVLSGEVLVGRGKNCDLLIGDEPGVSRTHARITSRDANIYISDLDSTNGTRVNGKRIKKETRLCNEDRLRFDLLEYVIEIPSVQPVEETIKMISFANSSAPSDPGAGFCKAEVWPEPQGLTKRSHRVSGSGADVTHEGSAPALILVGSHLKGTTIVLDDMHDKWTIGSGKEEDIVISDDGVSGNHALLERHGNKWILRDMMALNGTYVNSQKINFKFLSDGDIVDFGPVKCRFFAPAGFVAGINKAGIVSSMKAFCKLETSEHPAI